MKRTNSCDIGRTISALFATSLLVAACSKQPTPVDRAAVVDNPQMTMVQGGDISWYEGSVDEAFQQARIEGKPVFLYWGAEWCPPCHAINATVFRDADFIARSKLFIPVYLDGDAPNAQAIGERYSVLGYPTMIVFDSNGDELTRIPGGIDLQSYNSVLDLTLAESISVEALVAELMAKARPLKAAECRLLAYYAWNQSRELLDTYDEPAIYRAAYDSCPATMATERSVLYLSFLDAMVDAMESGSADKKLTRVQSSEAMSVVGEILGDPELIKANVISLIFSGANMARVLTASNSDERVALVGSLNRAMDTIAADERIFKRERVYATLGKIFLEQIDDSDAKLSAILNAQIVDMARWADESTRDPYERQAVINAVSNVLRRAKKDDVAKPILLAELERSKEPYYYMPALAEIEQRAGDFTAAISWLRTAYDTARGPATRFQWGYYYIEGLLQMTPDDTTLIHATTIKVMRELEAGAGLYQRPKAQFRRLERLLIAWSQQKDRLSELRRIRGDVLLNCDKLASQPGSPEFCRTFLDSV